MDDDKEMRFEFETFWKTVVEASKAEEMVPKTLEELKIAAESIFLCGWVAGETNLLTKDEPKTFH